MRYITPVIPLVVVLLYTCCVQRSSASTVNSKTPEEAGRVTIGIMNITKEKFDDYEWRFKDVTSHYVRLYCLRTKKHCVTQDKIISSRQVIVLGREEDNTGRVLAVIIYIKDLTFTHTPALWSSQLKKAIKFYTHEISADLGYKVDVYKGPFIMQVWAIVLVAVVGVLFITLILICVCSYYKSRKKVLNTKRREEHLQQLSRYESILIRNDELAQSTLNSYGQYDTFKSTTSGGTEITTLHTPESARRGVPNGTVVTNGDAKVNANHVGGGAYVNPTFPKADSTIILTETLQEFAKLGLEDINQSDRILARYRNDTFSSISTTASTPETSKKQLQPEASAYKIAVSPLAKDVHVEVQNNGNFDTTFGGSQNAVQIENPTAPGDIPIDYDRDHHDLPVDYNVTDETETSKISNSDSKQKRDSVTMRHTKPESAKTNDVKRDSVKKKDAKHDLAEASEDQRDSRPISIHTGGTAPRREESVDDEVTYL